MNKTFALLALVLVCSASVEAAWTTDTRATSDSVITLSSCTSRVRSIIDDPNTTSGTVRYSSATIHSLINVGQRIMAVNTMSIKSYATQSLTINTTEYLMPSDCIAIDRITLTKPDGKGPKVIPQSTVFHLDVDKGKEWSIKTSTPTAYYIRNRHIGMYPYPNGSNFTLTVWYTKLPAYMTAESDYVFDGYNQMEIHWNALASYAAAQLLMQDGNTALADKYFAEFVGGMESAVMWMNNHPAFTPNMSGADNYNYKKQ